MAIEGLAIIGETINDSVPKVKERFDANDIDAILEIARFQDERGAAYIDVNVGPREPAFMANLVQRIQEVTTKPLSIDTPDFAVAEAGLRAYDPARADGEKPILNSITSLRIETFDLLKVQPFRPILLISENVVDGNSKPCHTAEETYQAAQHLLAVAKTHGLTNDDCIFDPGIAPIGSDSEGNLKRLLDAMRIMHEDPEFAGVHASVGLSNFTVMLPAKRADGSLVKGPLASAFLTLAMPLGLDMVIGSVQRRYQKLEPDHPAMACVNDVVRLGGFEAIMRVSEFYSQ